jgi:uncharacterized membrane protein
MLRERVFGSDLDTFLEVILLAGLSWEVTTVGVLVCVAEGVFG